MNQSFLRVIINGNEVEGWKKHVIATVVVLTGFALVVFAFMVVAFGLIAMFTGGPS